MTTLTLTQRLEKRKAAKLSDIREIDRKIRELDLQRERLRGEVAAFEDAIYEAEQPSATPAAFAGEALPTTAEP